MQFTFHRTGTVLYGERDYWPPFVRDNRVGGRGTFSKRISYTNDANPFATYYASGYYVYETTAPNVRQVVYVYGWFAVLIGIIAGFGLFKDDLGEMDR